MPAAHMTRPNGGPVLPTARRRAPATRGEVVIDAAFLAGFGALEAPRTLWQALGGSLLGWSLRWSPNRAGSIAATRRAGTEPWEGALAAAMAWPEPSRSVALPGERALRLIEAGPGLRCVWSGRRLDALNLDIDHCLPWSAWPCGGLWNVLPARRVANQREKRDRLPADGRLRAAGEAIQQWWREACLPRRGPSCPAVSPMKPGPACRDWPGRRPPRRRTRCSPPRRPTSSACRMVSRHRSGLCRRQANRGHAMERGVIVGGTAEPAWRGSAGPPGKRRRSWSRSGLPGLACCAAPVPGTTGRVRATRPAL